MIRVTISFKSVSHYYFTREEVKSSVNLRLRLAITPTSDPQFEKQRRNRTSSVTMAATNPSSSLSSSPISALTKLNGKGGESITGFVLKLNNMVNGAPDDIVSVSE